MSEKKMVVQTTSSKNEKLCVLPKMLLTHRKNKLIDLLAASSLGCPRSAALRPQYSSPFTLAFVAKDAYRTYFVTYRVNIF